MARNIIEEIRKDAISDIFGNRKFCSCWEIWKPLIKEKCDNCNHAKALLDMVTHCVISLKLHVPAAEEADSQK